MDKNEKNKGDFTEFCGDADYIAQGILQSDFVYDAGAKGLEGGAFTLKGWRDEFYYWQEGCWLRISKAEMRRKIARHIQALNDTMRDTNQQISISTNRINNILLCLMGRIGIDETVESSTWADGREALLYTIPVNNGLLEIDYKDYKPLLIGHTPQYFGLTKLPYSYDPDATCPEWEEFVDDVMGGRVEYISLLQQWCGYLLRPDLREHKFLLCVGEGSNGKTVFFDVIEAMIGAENCSHVGLSQLHRPFALYPTLDKAVNMTTESNKLIEDEGENVLKALVSGDRTAFERKFRDPIPVKPTAKFMIATNARPRFNDKTQGIWRRILLCPFDKVIEDAAQIADYADQLKKELPGILNWALKGLKILNDNGRFKMPEKNKELIEEYRKDADPARAFLLEYYMVSLDGIGTPCAEVFQAYCQYCETNKCRPMNNRTFGRQIKRVFPDAERKLMGDRANQTWTYIGLVNQVN